MTRFIWDKYIGTSTGWKKAAKVNCALLISLSIVLSICLVLVLVGAEGIFRALLFYEAPCTEQEIPVVNLFLHLLINVVSTLVMFLLKISSSNFFMQVLNAPSRDEVDAAHRKGIRLNIGVFSIRNTFMVSRFKAWCWLGLFVTSIPIHLLFNSAVFRTEYRQSDFTVTIATEDFLNGGPYYPPGASLLAADGDTNFLVGFGLLFNLTQYITTGSGVEKNVSDAALHGNEWDKLDLSECQSQFGLYGSPCNGLERYSDVVLVIQNPDGWIRKEMWHLTGYQARFWDPYVPPDRPNHLFYYTACTMSPIYNIRPDRCINSCPEALGGAYSDIGSHEIPKSYPFFVSQALRYANETSDELYYLQSNLTSGLQPGTFNLSVQYCLARPLERTCHIGVSPVLLLVVVLCVIGKTSIAVLATIVLGRRNQRSLVTLGDYLASFIEKPDVETSCFSATANLRGMFILVGRTRWQIPRRRRAVVISPRLWFISFSLFVLAIAINVLLLFSSKWDNGGLFIGGFLAGNQNPLIRIGITFLGCVLIANTPQVLLSLWYFGFNNLFTHLQVANEWEHFGTDYLPLRVTEPEGKQKSTYRLQLPYRYSLPLIVLGALLHWLLSNTIYVFVSNGGYLDTDYLGLDPSAPDPSLFVGAVPALGYSPISLFVVIVLSSISVVIPVLFSLKRVSPHIVTLGSNSLLISMACRVSPLSLAERSSRDPDVESENSFLTSPLPTIDAEGNEETDSLLRLTELRFPLGSHDEAEDGEGHGGVGNGELYDDMQAEEPHSNMDVSETTSDMENRELHGNMEYTELGGDVDNEPGDSAYMLQKIARSKIRWGVLKMPPEWLDEHDYEPLGFGVEGDEVTTPVEGKWYL